MGNRVIDETPVGQLDKHKKEAVENTPAGISRRTFFSAFPLLLSGLALSACSLNGTVPEKSSDIPGMLNMGGVQMPLALERGVIVNVKVDSLRDLSGKNAVLAFKTWESALSPKDRITYKYILPKLRLVIAKMVAESDSDLAVDYLLKAQAEAKATNQLLYEGEASQRLAGLYRKQELTQSPISSMFQALSKTPEKPKYVGELERALSVYTSFIKEAKADNISIPLGFNPEQLYVNIAQIVIQLGNYHDKVAINLKGKIEAERQKGVEEKDLSNLLKEYQNTRQLALNFYLESVQSWPNPELNPEAYFRAAKLLFYFAADRNNWDKAKVLLAELKAVIDSEKCKMPRDEDKNQWKSEIDEITGNIELRMKNWSKVEFLVPKPGHKKEFDSIVLHIYDDGTGKFSIMLDRNTTMENLELQTKIMYACTACKRAVPEGTGFPMTQAERQKSKMQFIRDVMNEIFPKNRDEGMLLTQKGAKIVVTPKGEIEKVLPVI